MLCLTCVLLAACDNNVIVNPGEFLFGGVKYEVGKSIEVEGSAAIMVVSGNKKIKMEGLPTDARHLAPCPPPAIFIHQIDDNKSSDVAFYHCGFISIYLQGQSTLENVKPIEAKLKEGKWIWIDSSKFPGLGELMVAVKKVDPEA